MKRPRVAQLIAAVTLLGMAALWSFSIGEIVERLPEDFSYTAEVISVDNFYDAERDAYSGEIYSDTEYYYDVLSSDNEKAIIRNVFSVNTLEGESIFSVRRLYGIDRKSRAHVTGYGDKDRTGYLFAPPHLKAGEGFTYWHVNYDAPAQMQYVGKEDLYGLKVYHYETNYEDQVVDQTENLTYLPGVGETRGVRLEPHLELWIEPVTGMLVKYEDDTVAYYYDLATGEDIHPWNHFSNTFHERSVIANVERVLYGKTLERTVDIYVPGFLIAIALWLLALAGGLVHAYTSRVSTDVTTRAGALLVGFVALAILIGWAANIDYLLSVAPLLAGMNPMTGIGFLLLAAGMCASSHRHPRATVWVGGLLVLLSLLQLAGLLEVIPFQIDLALFKERVLGADTPSRMAQYTALCFFLLGLVMLSSRSKQVRRIRLAEVLATTVALFSLITIIGHLFDSLRLLHLPVFFSASLTTALLFLGSSMLVYTRFRDREQGSLGLRAWIAVTVVLLSSVILTVILVGAVDASLSRQAETGFAREVARASRLIEDRVDVYIGALEGARGLLSASTSVERGEWKAYVDTLALESRYPGIQGVGYAIFVPASEREAHEAAIQEEGFPEYQIKPPGSRDPYTAIIYLEPFDERNRQAFGFDMYQEVTRRAAMDRARDSGLPRLSGKITLVQEIDEDVQPGFLIYVPYYGGSFTPGSEKGRREQIVGYTYSPFRARNFIEGIIGESGLQDIGLVIADGVTVSDEEAILYDDSQKVRTGLGERFVETQTIFVAGRPWTLEFTSAPEYGYTLYARLLVLGVLVTGIAVSLMITLTFLTLIGARSRAVSYARVLTKDLEAAKAKDEAILRSLGDGLVVTDEKGVIVFTNRVFEQLLGFSATEVAGRALADVVEMVDADGAPVGEDRRLITRVLEERKIRSTDLETVQYRAKDGSLIPVAITVAPILQGAKVVGAVEVFRDISREKEVDRAKTEFVSLASHQLRTPLSSINWYSEMLLDGDAGKLSDEQKQFIKEIQTGNKRMVELVNALLNVSRIDLGTFMVDPEPARLQDIADDVLKELTPSIETKGMHVERVYDDALGEVNVDKKLTRIVFQNLLTNAVKYTPDGGTITVRLKKDEESRVAVIEVQDTGMGIPDSQKDKIFTKMFRADNVRAVDADGTGLGLYIIKAIIDQVGGAIRFASKVGKGTVFTIVLPLEGMKSKGGSKPLEPSPMPTKES